MAILSDVTFGVAQVELPAPRGRIDRILYWIPGMSGTLPLDAPVSLSIGTPLTLYVVWTNFGQVPFTGHTDLEIYKPDGTTLTPVALNGQDVVAPPGNGATPQFSAVVLDQVGAWRGRATLSG